MNPRQLHVVVPWETAGLITVVALVLAGQPVLALVLLTVLSQRCGCAAHRPESTPHTPDAAKW